MDDVYEGVAAVLRLTADELDDIKQEDQWFQRWEQEIGRHDG